ncbi:MAG TPA: hypothetical protein VMB85_04620 [Bryobacteraceae bacterium]|nr:hypothetical protein [Bryobacteraceae bacterium]
MIWLALLLFASSLWAQRVVERGNHVIYADSSGRETDAGIGFSPVLIRDGKVALLRGRKFGYGDDFNCAHRETKNRVAVFDPRTRSD